MAPSTSQTVGLLGIGLLGSALAERLLAGSFHVVGFDVVAQQRARFAELGGEPVTTAAEVAQRAARIVVSLPDSKIVADVIAALEKDLSGVRLIIDTTTGAPQDSQSLAARLDSYAVGFLDTTVAGSSQQVRNGDALLLIGGEASHLAQGQDILDAICRKQFFLGAAGSGAKMKLVVNLAIGLHRAVLAEALAFGEAFGFESALVLDVLRASPGHSRMMDTKGEKMVRQDFAPQARLRQHLKDVDLMLAAAAEHFAQLPLTELHAQLLRELVDRGFGEEDNSAIVRAFRRQD